MQDEYSHRLDDEGRELVDGIVQASVRMRRLLDDLLVLSRARCVSLPTEEISGRDIAEEALARLEGVVRKVGAKVTVEPNLPQLFADRTWATQGVYNFVANALKFVREGHPPEIEIAAFHPNGEPRDVVGIVVRDRGPGIPSEMTEEIFELFRRAVGREIEGSGAGLAIARAVAKRHGGHAWVQPRDGGGSEFIITFGTRKRQEALHAEKFSGEIRTNV